MEPSTGEGQLGRSIECLDGEGHHLFKHQAAIDGGSAVA